MTHLALAAAIVCALFCICVAGIKNRDMASWFVLGAALPVIAPIVILALPALDLEGNRMR